VQAGKGRIEGEIVHVDRFGNLITNIGAETMRMFGDKPCEVFSGTGGSARLRHFTGGIGRPAARRGGSTGFLEIAVNGASAADWLDLGVGTR